MKIKRTVCLLFMLGLGSRALPCLAESVSYQIDAGSSISFEASSTLHPVHGIAHSAVGELLFDPGTWTAGPFTVNVPVWELDTGNSVRDKAMRKMFGIKAYPVIRWDNESLECAAAGSRKRACVARGKIAMHGQSREIAFPVEIGEARDGALYAEGSFEIQMPWFDLKPPSVLGLIRVSDNVKVRFHTLWKPSVRAG